MYFFNEIIKTQLSKNNINTVTTNLLKKKKNKGTKTNFLSIINSYKFKLLTNQSLTFYAEKAYMPEVNLDLITKQNHDYFIQDTYTTIQN